MSRQSVIATAIVIITCGNSAYAHHSFAMFDGLRTVDFSGTVSNVQWASPHVWIEVTVADKDGKTRTLNVEGPSPAQLVDLKWRRDSIAPGDRIVISIHPLKSGQPGGALVRIVKNGIVFDTTKSGANAASSAPAGR